MPTVDIETGLIWGSIYGALVLIAIWLAMVVWVYRDMGARSRDAWAQILVTVMVFFLNVPGLLIYLLLRPRETLSEAYERSLEEEALLQEIEGKPNCPGCGQRVGVNWQVCPNCHTRLKKPCIQCAEMLQISWDLCPYCATPQTTGVTKDHAHVSRTVRRSSEGYTIEHGQSVDVDALEFIDEEY